MNRLITFSLVLVVVGLLAGTSLFAESNLLWVGGVSQDATDPANWDNGDPQGNRLFININTGNYPIFNDSGYSAGYLNVWDFLIGSNGTQGATTSGTPGRFDQTGGTIDLNYEMQIGGTASGHSVYNMSGDSNLTKYEDGGDILIGARSNTASGEFNMSDNAKFVQWHNGIDVGSDGGTGMFTMTGNSAYNLYDGWFSVGSGPGSHGTVATAGTMSLGNVLFIGRSGGTGAWTQSGGSTIVANKVYLGEWDSDQGPGVGILNLNGGVFTTKQISYSDWRSPNTSDNQGTPATVLSTQTVNFNGGTLQASQNELNFINTKGSPNFNVYIQAGGAKIDTNGYDIGLQIPLKTDNVSTGGGLTKIGSGSLTLKAFNTYTGATIVNAGSLIVPTPYSLATTSVSVANGATLQLGGASTLTSPLTSLGLANGSTLALDLTSNAAAGNTINTASLANKSGLTFVLGAQGTSLDTSHVYTLITGYSNTTTATAPTVKFNIRGYNANVTVGNTATTVAVTGSLASANLVWAPASSSDWDLNKTANWTGAADGKFMELDNVTFPDLGATQNVNVVDKIHPTSIAISNSYDNYNFNGTGSIIGIGTTVTKTGLGTATFNVTGGISYTGTTTLSGGILEFGSNTAPSTLPGNFVFNGGALSVASSSYDSTLTLTGSVSGDFIKTGTGTLTIDQNSTATTNVLGSFKVQQGTTALVNGVAAHVSTAKIGSMQSGSLTISQNSSFASDGNVNIGVSEEGAPENGLIVMQGGNANRNSGSHIEIAGNLQNGWDNHGNGTFVMMGSSSANVTGSATFAHNTASGQLIMSENSTFNVGNDLVMGEQGGHGAMTLSGLAHVNVAKAIGFATSGAAYEPGTAGVTLSDATELHGGTSFLFGGPSNFPGYAPTLVMKGGAWLDLGTAKTNDWSDFGLGSGWASVDISQGARMTVANKGISLGEGNGSNGAITLHDGASITVTATQATRTNTGVDSDYNNGAFLIGARGGSGTLTLLDGSSVTGVNTNIQLAANYDSSSRQAPGVGVVTVTGGSRVMTTGTGSIIIGNNGGIGIWNQSGGTTTTPNTVILGEYDIEHRNHPESGAQATGSGTLTLTGGVFQAPQITTHTVAAAVPGTSGTISFRGGVLQASAASANFITSDGNGSSMSLLVNSGSNSLGAILDTQAFNVTINAQFQHDASAPDTDGGLMKLGSGILTLAIDPAYNGNTTVNDGKLVVLHLNTPSATVYVASNGTLTTSSIKADTLTIGGGMIPHAASMTSVAPVPEPSTLVLLALAGVATLLAAWRRK